MKLFKKEYFFIDRLNIIIYKAKINFSPVAQSAEQVAVNHRVRGSSPCWGAIQI